jgi:hypothetical protein
LREIDPPQLVASAVQPHLDRAFGDAEAGSDRPLGEILVVAHLQQLAVLLAEAAEGGTEVGKLDRGEDPRVLLALPLLEGRCQVRPQAGVLAKRLVADDRRQPLVATGGIAQGRAPTPGPEQGVLGYVLRLARIARVAVSEPETDPLRLTPLPAIVVPAAMPLWSSD